MEQLKRFLRDKGFALALLACLVAAAAAGVWAVRTVRDELKENLDGLNEPDSTSTLPGIDEDLTIIPEEEYPEWQQPTTPAANSVANVPKADPAPKAGSSASSAASSGQASGSGSVREPSALQGASSPASSSAAPASTQPVSGRVLNGYSGDELVYNKTLFEENGWETPVTWDDFFELGEKAKEKGIALFTYQGIYPGYLESMLWPALASATGIDNMKAIASYTPGSLSSDEALKVFQNMAKIGTDGYLMDGTVALNHTQSQTDMMMNKALFIPNGNWMEGEMADAPRADGFEFGLTCAPVLDGGEARYVMSSVEQFEIPANAKNPELAKEFLRFLYTEDSVKLFAEKANGIYALKKANEMVKGIVTDGVYNMNDIYQEGTFMVFGWDAMPDTSKVVIADSVFNVASDVMNGDMTAEQWRDGIEAAFEEIAASK